MLWPKREAPLTTTVDFIKNSLKDVGYVWVKCSLVEANVLEEKKKIKISWASVKVNLLPAKRMQCFRYLKIGHTKARCDSETNRSGLCYNCGQGEHKAIECKLRTKCILCDEASKVSNHRIGGPCCTAPLSKGRISVFRRSQSRSPEKTGREKSTQVNSKRQEEEMVVDKL